MIVAVLTSGWRGGFGPGLTTSVLGALALIRFVINKSDSFLIEGVESQAGIILYLVVTVGIAVVCDRSKARPEHNRHRPVHCQYLPPVVLAAALLR